PYDVIDTDEQNALYAASPYNFVRIMLNRPTEGDNDADNPYTRAAGFLREWRQAGILVEDAVPTFYLYRQEFTNPVDDTRKTRTALLSALKLEPYAAGVVLPHEETRTKAKEDRLRLMRATRTNPEPIFGLYEDDAGVVIERAGQTVNRAGPLL